MSALTADELELLLLTSRVAPSVAAIARAEQLAKESIRWDRLFDVANRHSVVGLVGANWMKVAGSRLPEALIRSLRQRSQRDAMSGMFMSTQLVAILKALSAANIPAISFKGPTLAVHAYGGLSARIFGDVDVLVAPRHAIQAAKILKVLGFEGWDVAAEHEAHHLRSECEETFVRSIAGGNVTCDLHWALSRGYLPFAVPFQELWNRSKLVRVTGTPIATLGCEDLLLYLCLHGSKHAWEKLIWVCDIAELLRVEPGLDWNQLFTRADETGNARCLRLGLLLARDLLAAMLPGEIDARVCRDHVAMRMSRLIRTQLFEEKKSSERGLAAHLHTSLFHLQLRDRLRDQVRYIVGAALPNVRDQAALPLPQQFLFLHYLIRPLRLLSRYGLRRA